MAMPTRRIPATVVLLIGLALPALARSDTRDFALHDGDTVVFLGDSITAARTYGRIIEDYTRLRFPDRKVHFHNAGWGGDTAAGGLKRLERDVFSHGATVLTVAYGINDIGWGTRADEAHKQLYLDSIRGIVEQCKKRGVRVYICSAAITAEDPDRSEHGYLQRMCDEGMAVARSLDEHAIDVQRTMREIQRKVLKANVGAKKPEDVQKMHAADGIHLNDLGQLAMAFAILKGLDAPADVSSLTIDAAGPSVVSASGCRASNLSARDDRLEFDRLDDGLPLNLGLFGALSYRFVPIPDELNRYPLTVQNLRKGRYDLSVENRALGTYESDVLAGGVNIASATADGWEPGGPWEAEAWVLKDITEARDKIATSRRFLDHYLPNHPAREAFHAEDAAIDQRIEELQRTLLRPRPFHFVVRRVDGTSQAP
jgi:lysophospholipase L1-like esterase